MNEEEFIDDLQFNLNQDPEQDLEDPNQEDLEEDHGELLDDPSPIIDNLSLYSSDNYDLSTIETLLQDNNDTLHSINDNMFRLYYFVGGLYVVFMIVLAIRFFKQFF